MKKVVLSTFIALLIGSLAFGSAKSKKDCCLTQSSCCISGASCCETK